MKLSKLKQSTSMRNLAEVGSIPRQNRMSKHVDNACGRYADGGEVKEERAEKRVDERQDKRMMSSAVHKHERAMHSGKSLTPMAAGGALTAKKRNALPGKDFAGPDRSYPINDASHARNALARVSQHGSPALKAKVRSKVARKYPGIKQAKG